MRRRERVSPSARTSERATPRDLPGTAAWLPAGAYLTACPRGAHVPTLPAIVPCLITPRQRHSQFVRSPGKNFGDPRSPAGGPVKGKTTVNSRGIIPRSSVLRSSPPRPDEVQKATNEPTGNSAPGIIHVKMASVHGRIGRSISHRWMDGWMDQRTRAKAREDYSPERSG